MKFRAETEGEEEEADTPTSNEHEKTDRDKGKGRPMCKGEVKKRYPGHRQRVEESEGRVEGGTRRGKSRKR